MNKAAPMRRTLAPHTIQRLENARGTLVRVRSGRLWLTEPALADDIFLHARQSYRIRQRGLVLIEPADAHAVEFCLVPALPYAEVVRCAWRMASGVVPVQRLKARWKALGSEKPSK